MYSSIEGRPGKLQRAGLLFRMWGLIAPSRDIDRAHTKREIRKQYDGHERFGFAPRDAKARTDRNDTRQLNHDGLQD